ncbi:hypothetical protein [Leifsonia sp. 2MCAF36]|uniref:hypothetical protein n=1 Tax=Leifsonia sp. 2MCAF36 TaxID=3232988 RepID=UPI003F972759
MTFRRSSLSSWRGEAVRVFAWTPVLLYGVAVGFGAAGLLIGVPPAAGNIGILIVAGVLFAVSLAVSYFAVREETGPSSSAFIGQLFAVGFWQGSWVFRLSFLLVGAIAVLTFAAGAAVLPRGTTVEKVGDTYFRVDSGRHVALTAAEAQYLYDAQSTLVPIGGG